MAETGTFEERAARHDELWQTYRRHQALANALWLQLHEETDAGRFSLLSLRWAIELGKATAAYEAALKAFEEGGTND